MNAGRLGALYNIEELVEDAELIRRILAKDKAAEEALVAQTRKGLLATATHFLGYQDPDVEDAVQEAYLAAFAALPKFEGRSKLSTWLNRICVNACFARLDKRQRRMEVLGDELEALSLKAAREQHQDLQQQDEKREALRVMAECLAQMGQPCRSLLQGHHLLGASCAELAEKTKVPIGTVMGRLARCREALKQSLMERWEGEKR